MIEFYDKKAELWQYRQGKVETTEEGGEGEEEAAQDNVRLATTERGEDTHTHVHTHRSHWVLLCLHFITIPKTGELPRQFAPVCSFP